MRIFLAGATGVIGARLVPLLISAGHQVAGMTRSPEKLPALRALGAEPVLCDVFDLGGLVSVVQAYSPDLVMHQLTDLPDEEERIPGFAARNNRVRSEGTRNLLGAAEQAGTGRLLAQSIAWTPAGGGETVVQHEAMVLAAGGVVIRYGVFYGPGTYWESGRLPPPPRVHVDEAARRTLPLLETPPGVVVIAEEPSEPGGAAS